MRTWLIAVGATIAMLVFQHGHALAQRGAAEELALTSLDVAAVATGGAAVTALAAGHRVLGGWIQNPSSATTSLCINERGTATGTTSSGDTTCIVPGQTYLLAASSRAVSVIASDAGHVFSGYGWD